MHNFCAKYTREGDVLKDVNSLLHSAIYEIISVVNLKQGAAARYLMRSADKLYLHISHTYLSALFSQYTLFCVFIYSLKRF